MPVQDIGSWSAEDCLLDICLLAGPIYAQVASLIYAQGHWWRAGWNIANMQFVVLVRGGLESDENIDTA